MNQRGNQLYAAGGAILLLVGILAAGAWYVGAQRAQAKQEGITEERGRWQARESAELAAANAEILRLQADVTRREQAGAAAIASLAATHQEELNRVQADRDRFLDDLAAGRVRFYVPGAAASKAACSSPGPATPAAAGRGDGEEDPGLPPAVAAFLHGEATRADEIVAQLALAQGVIEEDRRICR